MIKILRCFLLVFLCIAMLSSCQIGNGTVTTPEDTGRRFRNADTLEKYNDFMDKFVFSNSFITYDSLSDLGEFDKFYIHYCMGAKEKYTEEELALLEFSEEYHYKLKGKNGSELYIQVHFAPEFDEVIDRPPEYQHLEECPESFLTSEWEGLEYNGIYYVYGQHKSEETGQRELYEIIFCSNGNQIAIHTWNNSLYGYFIENDMEGDNLLSCLIKGNPDNIDLASYLIQEIKVNDVTIRKGMTYQEVVELMGNEGTSVGFGLIIYAWDISEDEALYVWFQKGVTDSWDDMTVDSFEIKNKSEISE